MGVHERYRATLDELGSVCEAAGRSADDVRLVAVSKTVGLDEVACAIRASAADFGENRPDQLVEKHDAFPDVRWHFIGNIQSRRIRDIVGRAALIHSLFERRHAAKIDEVAGGLGIVQDVLLEVNVSGEQSKSGLAPEKVADMLEFCSGLPNVAVCGLMTMAPIAEEALVRATFSGLRELRDDLRARMDGERARRFGELSMGMSGDWPVAVEEGATIVRIGRAVFAERF